jgi:RNA polymerase sigma factor (sigma-70 family)
MARTASSPILQLIRRVYRDPRVEGSADQDLLRRFLGERDEAAFEMLLQRHGAMVLDVCRGVLGNEADVEDAFQATFLILARRAESIRKGASLASFLHGVAYRTALRARADSARRQRHEARAPQRSSSTDPDELTWREIRRVVHEELDRLPERHRAALVLCYLQGKTQDEAAVELGLPKGTLKGHLERGRALLQARLVRRGLGPGVVLALATWPASTRAVGLSGPLVSATVKTATAFAAGKAAVSVVSPSVAALSEGMVKAMFFRKLKIAAILFLALAGSGTGLALFIQGPPRTDAGGAWEQSVSPAKPGPGADVAAKPAADSTRPIRSLRGHVNRLTSIAYSPDGTSIATASWDGTARIWDAKTGEEVRRLGLDKDARLQTGEPSSNTFHQIAFSPDNAFLVTVKRESTVPPPPPPAPPPPPNESVVIVWNPRTGEKLRTFSADGASFDISPDGKWIACGGSQVIHLYELATGKRVRELPGGEKQLVIVSLTFSPDGKTLISTGHPPTPQRGDGVFRLTIMPDVMRLWDVATGEERRSALNGVVVGRHGCQPVAFSKDGRIVIHASEVPPPGGSGYDISLREVATGGERTRLTGHKGDLRAFALSPDGRTLASGSMDGTVRLWDLLSGKEVGRLGKEVDAFKGGWVLAIAFSPDGRTLVSGGLDKTAHIWDVRRITGRRRETTERSLAQLEADWKDLAGDAAAGYAALGRLVSSHRSAVAFLEKQLQSIPPLDIRRIERLIADLDHEQFDVRERVARELEKLGERAEPALRKALAGKSSLEARRRLEGLVNRLESASPSAETVRQIRAVEVLESIGDLEAQRVLNKLAAGPPESRLTQEARAAVRRLPPIRP